VNGPLSSAVSGTHYLYADDGGNPGIDVFTLSGTTVTFLQHVNLDATDPLGLLGLHHLAVTTYTAGSPIQRFSCLAFATEGLTVYSFKIANNGMLSASPVSAVAMPRWPGDLAASGSILFESSMDPIEGFDTNSLGVLSFGPGCTLSLMRETSTGTHLDMNIALINANQLVTAESDTGNLVIYSLGTHGVLTKSAVQPGQIASPDSMAVWNTMTPTGVVSNVYTGQATSGPPQAQGFRVGAGPFDPLTGSPQTDTDPKSSNGAAVAVDAAHKLLVQANNGSGQIAWYKLAASSTTKVGSITFGGDTPLAASDQPISMAVFSGNLFVAQNLGGGVEDCALATTGVSGCHKIITLTGGGGGTSVAIK
jgi:hypothetical protein